MSRPVPGAAPRCAVRQTLAADLGGDRAGRLAPQPLAPAVSALMGRGKAIRDAWCCPLPAPTQVSTCSPGGGAAHAGDLLFPAASWVLLSSLCLCRGGGRGVVQGALSRAGNRVCFGRSPGPAICRSPCSSARTAGGWRQEKRDRSSGNLCSCRQAPAFMGLGAGV